MNDSGVTMGIEFSQIHNLVRTYQRMLNRPPSTELSEERTTKEPVDRVAISPQAREQNGPTHKGPIPDGLSQQDKERPI